MAAFKKNLARYYTYLSNGDFESLRALFPGEISLNTPIEGEIKGRGALAFFVRNNRGGLGTIMYECRSQQSLPVKSVPLLNSFCT